MEKTFFEFNGFKTLISFSEEDKLFVGQIENIKDIVSFHGKTVSECYQHFVKSVKDYIDLCKDIGKDIEFKDVLLWR